MHFEIHPYRGSRGFRVELVIAVSYEYWETGLAWRRLRLGGVKDLHADFPAPDGPIIKIFNVGRDSSDAIVTDHLKQTRLHEFVMLKVQVAAETEK